SEAPITAPSPEDTARYTAADPRTILVVEDNKDVKNVAVSLLEQLGYQTIAWRPRFFAWDWAQTPAIGETTDRRLRPCACPSSADRHRDRTAPTATRTRRACRQAQSRDRILTSRWRCRRNRSAASAHGSRRRYD